MEFRPGTEQSGAKDGFGPKMWKDDGILPRILGDPLGLPLRDKAPSHQVDLPKLILHEGAQRPALDHAATFPKTV